MKNIYMIIKLQSNGEEKKYYKQFRLDNWNMIYKTHWKWIMEYLDEDMKIELAHELSGDEIEIVET